MNSSYTFASISSFAKYSELEKFFEIQRSENEAARVIQKAWKRTTILLPWRHAALCHKMAQRIQKRIRGVLTRKWVAEWFQTRNTIVITWQAHSRRYVSNKHIVPKLAHEKAMAIRIQKMIRGRLARVRCLKKLRDICVTHIQALWRGVVGRLFTDKIWLQKTVIPLQCLYRRRLAQKRFGAIRDEFNHAAIRIQKKFRNWYSRRRLGNRLFEREMAYRMSNISMLTSEEELCQEHLTKAMERLVKNGYKEKAEKATKALMKCEAEIYLKENDLTEFRRQSEILSSRARAQGFDVELAKNIADTRDALTALKFSYIFDLSTEVHKADEALEDQVFEVETWAANRNRVAEWRSDQYEERRHLNYKRDILERRRAKRIAIAEEKRRWQVLYYTSDGKPDKKRRPGRPWDASIYAGGEKAVYTGGSGVNLMAHIQREKIKRAAGSDFKLGSIKSVEQTLQEVSLQTYLEEVNLYEQLLNPISKIMEQTMGVDAAGMSNLAKIGYGDEGAKVVPALQDIGVIPPPAQPKRGSSKKRVTISESSTRVGTALSTAESNRIALYNNAQKVNVLGDPALLSKQNSFNSTFSDATTASFSDGGFGDQPTPQEILASVKLRKKLARKSYLPSLDAFISSFDGSAEKKNAPQYIGDLKTLDRLYQQQAATGAGAASGKGDAKTRRSSVTRSPVRASMSMALPAKEGAGAMANTSPSRRSSQQLIPLSSATVASGLTTRTGRTATRALAPTRAVETAAVASAAGATEEEVYWHDINKAAREEAEARRLEVVEKRRAKKKALVRSSTIPWELLDQLEGAKHRFENEKLYHDFNHKY